MTRDVVTINVDVRITVKMMETDRENEVTVVKWRIISWNDN